ncbi:ABC transporter substrate-binding protein, partial [Listeria monocytogenes]|uniref:ABC transporter substrate-binding protein n=1 Tax=Listeria monocytogenes TaxID=1639 RepID=UPI003211E76F
MQQFLQKFLQHLILSLRKDAKWSNGEPITANDFEYSWKRTVDPKTASPQAYYFEGLK